MEGRFILPQLLKNNQILKFGHIKTTVWCEEFFPTEDDLLVEVRKTPDIEAALVYYLESLTYFAMPLTVGKWWIQVKKGRLGQLAVEAMVDINLDEIEICW